MTSLFLRILLWMYLPFLLLICGVMGWIIFLLAQATSRLNLLLASSAPVIVLLGFTILQVLWALRGLFSRCSETQEMEVCVPSRLLKPVHSWLEEISRRHNLWLPDNVRFGAETIAHVYEDDTGKRVLVLGGAALAARSQAALGGVIAHELAHFTAGDTRLSRKAIRRVQVMALLEYNFASQPGSFLNPLAWFVRLYHVVFGLVWAAHSRQQEFAADRWLLEHVGGDTAAQALLHLAATERLPWVRLANIAKAHVAANDPIEHLFAEHWRRAQSISADDWEQACRKELKRKTGFWDTHPSLKDRPGALGVSSRHALRLVRDQQSPRARELFPEWPKIEKLLTEKLLAVFLEEYFGQT